MWVHDVRYIMCIHLAFVETLNAKEYIHIHVYVQTLNVYTYVPLRLSTCVYRNVLMFALHVCFLSYVYLLLVCYARDFPWIHVHKHAP